MMKTFLLMTVAACLLLACTKSGAINPGFFGKWELRRTYGGFGGFDSTYNVGNGTAYQFNADSTYKQFTRGKLIAQGVFHIKTYQDPSQPAIASKEIFFDENTNGDPIYITGTKLTIGTTADDGLASDYEKVQN